MQTLAQIAAGLGQDREGGARPQHPHRSWSRLAAATGATLLALAGLSTAGGTAFAAQSHTKVAHTKVAHTKVAHAKVAHSGDRVVVDVASVPKYGKILVDQKGLALYIDTANKPPKVWPCKGACLTVWPPLVLAKGQSKPVAGKGVSGLSVVKGPSGEQVTWHGKPLYTFVRDSKGKVLGQGIVQDGTWKVVQTTQAATKATAAGKHKTSTTKPASHWA